jgi:uncharacterized glyoxalase superfamily protein PhnB
MAHAEKSEARRRNPGVAWLWDAEPHRLYRGYRAVFSPSKTAGVTIVEDLHETVYGELQYGAEDLDGHHWLFSRHARNLSTDQWGAAVSHAAVLAPQISPMLAVGDPNPAIKFYKAAFDANVLWHLGGDEHVVAGLSVYGAQFFLATESPSYGTRGPAAAGFATVRIERFVEDPEAVQRKALAAGAVFGSQVIEHTHATIGPRPIRRLQQGSVVDPFGHMWLIGRIVE